MPLEKYEVAVDAKISRISSSVRTVQRIYNAVVIVFATVMIGNDHLMCCCAVSCHDGDNTVLFFK